MKTKNLKRRNPQLKVSLTMEVKAQKKRRQRYIKVEVHDELCWVPVSDELYERWTALFVRKNGTDLQRRRYITTLQLMAECILFGREQGPRAAAAPAA